MSVVGFVYSKHYQRQPTLAVTEVQSIPRQRQVALHRLPDVYHVIFDGLGRPDILAHQYHVDTSRYLASLGAQGMRVSHSSYANYGQTYLSLASMFNMRYLDPLERLGSKEQSRLPLKRLIEHNAVTELFRSAGYRIHLVSTRSSSHVHERKL